MNERSLLPKGTRITDKNNPELSGAIVGIIALSKYPYILKWDNEILALRLRGVRYYWGADEIVEVV